VGRVGILLQGPGCHFVSSVVLSYEYSAGQTVLYTDGNYYTSLVGSNLNNIPSSSHTKWAPIPDRSNVATGIIEWDVDTAYTAGAFVDYAGVQYICILANSGIVPLGNASFWAALTGGTLYLSLIDANMGNLPSSSPTKWTSTFVGGNSASQFLPLIASLTQAPIFYPIGAGPASQTSTRNVYQLPSGYLREAPQDPKAGSTSILGAPSGLMYSDWRIESNFIITREVQPIIFRFVTDIVNVSQFDAMFCEGLAARIALEVAQPLSQDLSKVQSIASQYQKFMTEARMVNGIETGSVEPPEDDYIACRI